MQTIFHISSIIRISDGFVSRPVFSCVSFFIQSFIHSFFHGVSGILLLFIWGIIFILLLSYISCLPRLPLFSGRCGKILKCLLHDDYDGADDVAVDGNFKDIVGLLAT